MEDFELEPSEQERGLVHGWERRPGGVTLLPQAMVLADVKRHFPVLERLSFAAEEWAAAQEYAVDHYCHGKPLRAQVLGDAAAGALVAMANGPEYGGERDLTERAVWPLVDYWVERGGAEQTMETLLAGARLETVMAGPLQVREAEHASLLELGYVGKWQRFREIVSGLSATEYGAAVVAATLRRTRLPLLLRAALAYAFPAEPSWAMADAQEAIAQKNAVAFNLLATSLASPELLARGLALGGPMFGDGRALTLLLRFGEPVAELLIEHALAEGTSRHSAIELLGMVRSVPVTRRLAPLLSVPRLRTSLLDALDRHPREALLALQGAKLPRDVALQGRLRDWQELCPDLTAAGTATPAKRQPAKAKRKTKGTPALPPGVLRVLQEPKADLPPAAQQALQDLDDALTAGREPGSGLAALANVPTPGAARRARVLISAWSAHGELALALSLVEALALAGHDFALGQLAALRDGASHRTLSDAAQARLATSTLGDAQLEDRKVDDFGLGAPLYVSLGARGLRYDFGPALGFVLRGEDGKAKTTFPPLRKDDDATRYAVAKRLWERLRTEAAPELRRQARRFEEAMVEERAWSFAELRGVLLQQPLLAHLARQLLWRATERGTATLFRVAEDGTLANEADAPFEPGARAKISLPHPLDIPEHLATWGARFADYEITQPFEQLGREFVPRAEPATSYAERLKGTVGPKARFVLAGQGWEGEEGFSYDGWTATKVLRGKGLSLWLRPTAGGRLDFHLYFEPQNLDAISRSEVYRDLAKCGLRTQP